MRSLIGAALILCVCVGCEGDSDDAGQTAAEVYCDTEATRSVKWSTSSAGDVAACSPAWAQATGEAPCRAPSDCEGAGRACVKKPGALGDLCVLRCGDGVTVCPTGMTCLQCEDSEPHCSTRSSCPAPRYPQVDGRGNPCDAWVPNCTDTVECCSTAGGRPSVCVETYLDFTTRDDFTSRTCNGTCETSADCSTGFCCLPFDTKESDSSAQIQLLGASGKPKTCFPPDIYDFCKSPASSGGSGGSGGSGSSGGGCGKCGTFGSHGSCCGPPFCAGDCIGSPCCS